MLNSNDRRPAFDAFFFSLGEAERTVFMDEALAQWESLIRCDGNSSIIDCMENVWDYWRELRHSNPAHIGQDYRPIMALMLDPNREAREKAYFG